MNLNTDFAIGFGIRQKLRDIFIRKTLTNGITILCNFCVKTASVSFASVYKPIAKSVFKKPLSVCMVFLLVFSTIVFSTSLLLSAENTKMNDVADPVLQEIINSFMSKTPRFITSMGSNIFVADAQINRKSLLMVLYEYNRSLKLPSTADLVTKKEFDELSAKILSGKYSGASAQNKNSDIAALIQSLEPNMPSLLDNNLSRSSVYNELRNDVANINEEVLALKNSNRTVSIAGASAKQSVNYSEIKNALSTTQEDFASIKLKVDAMEKTIKPNASETTSDKSALTKLSVGLSLVAALFIAR